MVATSRCSTLLVTTGYDDSGARFVDFSTRKTRTIPTGFILPSPDPPDNPPGTARTFTSRDEQGTRSAYDLVTIDGSKVAAVERIFRLRQHENLLGF